MKLKSGYTAPALRGWHDNRIELLFKPQLSRLEKGDEAETGKGLRVFGSELYVVARRDDGQWDEATSDRDLTYLLSLHFRISVPSNDIKIANDLPQILWKQTFPSTS